MEIHFLSTTHTCFGEAVTAKWHRRHIDEYNSLPFRFKARQMFKSSFLFPSLKCLSSDIEKSYGLVKDGYWQFSLANSALFVFDWMLIKSYCFWEAEKEYAQKYTQKQKMPKMSEMPHKKSRGFCFLQRQLVRICWKTIVRCNCLVPGKQDLHSTTGNYPSGQSIPFKVGNFFLLYLLYLIMPQTEKKFLKQLYDALCKIGHSSPQRVANVLLGRTALISLCF